jgi:hypothetical protein
MILSRGGPVVPANKSTTEFLNVDLDIRARSRLHDLLMPIARRILVLHQTEREASIELSANATSLEPTILRFVRLIKSLPPEARNIWDRCQYRRMNIGIQAGTEPYAAEFALSHKALTALASIHAEIVVTVYAPRP